MQMPRLFLGSQCVKLEIVYLTMDRRLSRAVTYRFSGGRVRSFRSWSRSDLEPPCIWTSERGRLFFSVQSRSKLFFFHTREARPKIGQHCSSILLRRWRYSSFDLYIIHTRGTSIS